MNEFITRREVSSNRNVEFVAVASESLIKGA